MKTGLGAFQLSLILTVLVALFALLMMWPNEAPYFRSAPKSVAEKNKR